MTYKEFKETPEYQWADVLEVYSENGEELDDLIEDEILDLMEVINVSVESGWVSVTLKTQGGNDQ